MNSLRSGLTVAAILLGTMTGWAGEETAGTSGSTARGPAGYTVTVPTGDRWEAKPSDDGAVYENRAYGATAFYSAGFSAAPAPGLASRKDFLAYVKQAVAETGDTFNYVSVRDEFTEKEQDGLWLVDCSLNRDHSNAYGGIITRIRSRYALDPREPGRVIVVWFAWYGAGYDEKRFQSEAATFLNSLRKTSQ